MGFSFRINGLMPRDLCTGGSGEGSGVSLSGNFLILFCFLITLHLELYYFNSISYSGDLLLFALGM